MKKIVVHCGFHKTGSSSIQKALQIAHHENAFIDFGLPQLLMPGNHEKIFFNHSFPIFTAYSKRLKNYHQLKKRGLTHSEAKQYGHYVRSEISRSLSRDKNIVISGEDISMLAPGELGQFVKELRASVSSSDETEIGACCYVRCPVDLFSSEVQQSVKGGFTLNNAIENRLSEVSSAMTTKLSNLKMAFFGNLNVSDFEKAKLHKYGISGHFLESNKISTTLHNDVLLDQEVNLSFSDMAVSLLSAINARIPLFINGRLNPQRRANDFLLFKDTPGNKFSISSELKNIVWTRTQPARKELKEQFSIEFSEPTLNVEKSDLRSLNNEEIQKLLHKCKTKMPHLELALTDILSSNGLSR